MRPFAWVLLGCLTPLAAWAAEPLDVERIVQSNEPAVLTLTGLRDATGNAVQSSACCIREDGLILTTAHQIAGTKDLQAHSPDGSSFTVHVEEVDAAREIALLKAEHPLPHMIRLGDASRLKSGAPLVSIAAPKKLDFSVVTGLVSNTNRTYRGYPVIQADLRASPGSSGGPVFDRDGALVGLIVGRLEQEDWVTVVNPINNAYALLARHGVRVPETQSASLEEEPLLVPAPETSEKERRAVEAYNEGVRAAGPAEKERAYALAVQLLPAFYEAWFNRGVTAAAAKNTALAEQAYTEAAKLRPGAVEVHRNLGRVYLAQKKYPEAAACFERAAVLAPETPASYNDLGEAYRQLKRREEACKAFAEALRLKEDYAAPHYNLGLMGAADGRREEAIRHFERYLELDPDPETGKQVRSLIEELKKAP